MKITEQKQGAVTVIKPEGPLVAPDTEQLKTQLMQMLDSLMGRLVLDMSAVPFVDSSGLEVLADVTETLAQSGRTLKLASETKTVREVLELTDLAGFFEHFDDVTNAVRSFL